MNILKNMMAIAGLALVMASCNSNYEKTASGLTYKIIKGDGKEKLKPGELVKLLVTIKVAPRDTVLFETGGHLPVYTVVDTTHHLTHDYNEVLPLCSVGDSLITVAQVDSMVKKGSLAYNEMFKRGDQIVTSMRIVKMLPVADQAKDQQLEMENEQKKEVAQLEKSLKDKGIKVTKSQNGVFVEVLTPGGGDKADNGKEVTVKYTGSLPDNGKVFDSNIDTSFKHGDPYKFVIGAGQVIPGWDEGIKGLSKGAKANLYVPAMLAYGARAAGPVIKPYSNLKFYVEVLDVANPPAATSRPMPPGLQEQLRQAQQQAQQQGGH